MAKLWYQLIVRFQDLEGDYMTTELVMANGLSRDPKGFVKINMPSQRYLKEVGEFIS